MAGQTQRTSDPRLLFNDYFKVSSKQLEEYGAFNISLVTDLPLFIDPFLIFHSEKEVYQNLHLEILKYLRFLREISISHETISSGLRKELFHFKEVEQNWFGFTVGGNKGRGLGPKFAKALHSGLYSILRNFGEEQITASSHLEKLCLIQPGVGRDSISDFTVNLIKGFLLEYTALFAKNYIDPTLCKEFAVSRVWFNYETETWVQKKYILPTYHEDYVILTPKDLLTKDESWINYPDLVKEVVNIGNAIDDDNLRSNLDRYFQKVLPDEPKDKQKKEAGQNAIKEFPEVIDHYIRYKEKTGDQAEAISDMKVQFSEQLFIENTKELLRLLGKNTNFLRTPINSYAESMLRIQHLKDVIEKQDGYKLFYIDGNPVKRESDFQIVFKLVWYGSEYDFNAEVNNGRGPADFKVSMGAADKTMIEFKLASNTHLKTNLQKQLQIYKEANATDNGIYVIFYFSEQEKGSVDNILKALEMSEQENIILIDSRNDNKPSASVTT